MKIKDKEQKDQERMDQRILYEGKTSRTTSQRNEKRKGSWDVWRSLEQIGTLGEVRKDWILELLKAAWKEKKYRNIPKNWKKIILTCKQKYDILQRGNCSGIKLTIIS